MNEPRHDLCLTYEPSGRSCWCDQAFIDLTGATVKTITASRYGDGFTFTFADGRQLHFGEGDWHVTKQAGDEN